MYEMSFIPDYYKHRVAVVAYSNYFKNYSDSFTECIKEYGIETEAFSHIKDALLYNPTCVVVIGPTMFHKPPRNKKILWVMLQTEQLFGRICSNQPFYKKNIYRLKPYLNRYDLILDGSQNNINGLKRITKTDILHFPDGWYGETDCCSDSSITNKDYDLIFVGDNTGVMGRRWKTLEYLKTRYKVYPKSTGLWDDEKIKAIQSSKIALNLHYDESRYMESARIRDYLSAKCFVLSEPIDDPFPLKLGVDYDEFFLTNICEKIDYYLQNDEKRERMAEHAFKAIRSYTLYDSMKIFVDWLIMKSYSNFLNSMRIRTKIKQEFKMRKESKNRVISD